MLRWIRKLFDARRVPTRPIRYRPMPECLEDRTVPSTGFVETPLVSNIPGLAPNTDMKLINPWGFIETPAGQFRVAANGTGRGILLDAQGEKSGADIIIPPPAGSPAKTTSTPTGVVTNSTADFVITVNGRSAPASLLFSTEDGTIAGWNPSLSQTRAVLGADQSANGAVYKLLAAGSADGANYLYATNFHSGTVDVFDAHFAPHTFFPGQFTDPNAPAGFAPFGVKNVDSVLFVTYAKQDADKHDDVAGPGNGFIDEFDTSGHFLARFASGTAAGGTLTALNSPIGATFAPAGFGDFGGDLLIGNFGDSHVSVFDPSTGAFLGQLQDTSGQPLVLDAGITGTNGSTGGLWGIGFGNGQGGAGTQTLFFATGPDDENDGVFGMVIFDPPGAGSAGAVPHAPSSQSMVDIRHDLGDAQTDLDVLLTSRSSPSPTVIADLIALNSALFRVRADLLAGQSADTDISAAVPAEQQLATDLGGDLTPVLRQQLHDLNADLTDMAIDLATLKT